MSEDERPPRYPSEDGPGASGPRIEISIRGMVGTERTTVIVSSPGTPPTRIVAVRAKVARAAGQRVAELIDEALAARDARDPTA